MATSKDNFDPETFVREAYAMAERMDFDGWRHAFTDDGIFIDNSIAVTYRGADLDYPVRQYGTAFADMHRELYQIWTIGNRLSCASPYKERTRARSPCRSVRCLLRDNRWTRPAPTSSNSRTAKSKGSIATRKDR
jgi:hypothetical protein